MPYRCVILSCLCRGGVINDVQIQFITGGQKKGCQSSPNNSPHNPHGYFTRTGSSAYFFLNVANTCKKYSLFFKNTLISNNVIIS